MSQSLGMIPVKLNHHQLNKVFELNFHAMEKMNDATQIFWLCEGMHTLIEKFNSSQRKKIIDTVINKLTTKENFLQARHLAKALTVLQIKLTRKDSEIVRNVLLGLLENAIHKNGKAQVFNIAEAIQKITSILDAQQLRILSQDILLKMEDMSDPVIAQVLSEVLLSINEIVDVSSLDHAFYVLLNAYSKTENTRHFLRVNEYENIAKTLMKFPVQEDAQNLIDVLKWPNCIRDCESSILRHIENRYNKKFSGNIWSAVEWAEGQGFDTVTFTAGEKYAVSTQRSLNNSLSPN